MTNYSFTLSFALPDGFVGVDDLDERLGEAGLLDVTVGLGVSGRVGLAVEREASSADIASPVRSRKWEWRCQVRNSWRRGPIMWA